MFIVFACVKLDKSCYKILTPNEIGCLKRNDAEKNMTT